MTDRSLHNLIDGHFQAPRGDREIELVNPVDEQVVATVAASSPDDVHDAVAAAERASASWRHTTPAVRQRMLLKLADAIEAHRDGIVEAQCRNTGQPKSMIASDEVDVSADQVRFFAGAARTLEGKSAGEYMDNMTSYIRREPIGVVGQVTPWNYPFMMAIWKIAPALAAGNTVVLKPSDTTPESTVLLARLAQDILPAGVLNVVLGDAETGQALVSHPSLGLVSITGSVRAGTAVAASAAQNLTRAHLELGGKAPAIVFPDADLETAAEGIAQAACYNAGQDCTAATRVLVHASVERDFVPLLVKNMKALTPGPPEDPDTFYGPLNNARHFASVTAKLSNLPWHAQILTGGGRVGRAGYFIEPTVISGVKQDDAIVQSETFGPVLTVQTFPTEDEAIRLANGVPYGLAASVWAKDHATIQRLTAALEFGCVWVNTHLLLVAEMPHGGFRHSGYGKDLSLYGLEDYTRIKHVMSNNR